MSGCSDSVLDQREKPVEHARETDVAIDGRDVPGCIGKGCHQRNARPQSELRPYPRAVFHRVRVVRKGRVATAGPVVEKRGQLFDLPGRQGLAGGLGPRIVERNLRGRPVVAEHQSVRTGRHAVPGDRADPAPARNFKHARGGQGSAAANADNIGADAVQPALREPGEQHGRYQPFPKRRIAGRVEDESPVVALNFAMGESPHGHAVHFEGRARVRRNLGDELFGARAIVFGQKIPEASILESKCILVAREIHDACRARRADTRPEAQLAHRQESVAENTENFVPSQVQGHRQAVFDRREMMQAVDGDALALGQGAHSVERFAKVVFLAQPGLPDWLSPIVLAKRRALRAPDPQLPIGRQAVKQRPKKQAELRPGIRRFNLPR